MNIIKTVRHQLAIVALLSVMGVMSSIANAQVEIDITGANVRGIPVAIVPFKVLDGSVLPHQIHEVVAFDLDASGKFESIAASSFLTRPSRPEDVEYKDWRFVNAEVLVIGEVWTLGADLYEVQFRLYDVVKKQQIGNGQRITGLSAEKLRAAAHVISDSVYKEFTGRSGAFQSRMAFIDRVEVDYQRYRYKLMVSDWDGYGAKEIYASWQPLLSPSWSPDTKQLAFVTYGSRGPIIKSIDLRTLKDRVIADFKGVNSAPAWSPDGTKIAYSTSRHGSPDIYVYDVLTKQHQRISSHYGIDTEPSWSPRGESFLFTSSRSGKPQIYSYSMNDESVTRMTFEGDESANASYNAIGNKIVMVHEGGRIAVMDEDSGRITPLTIAQFDESPSFSPNGDMVLYKTEQQFEPALMVASSDGRVRTRLDLVSGDIREPAWSPLRQ
jgi:TolB protein